MIEVNHYDINSLVNSPVWDILKPQTAAYGLVPIFLNQGSDIKGIELGVCCGINSYMLLESCPNISLVIGVDHYKAYKDWDREIQQHEQDHNFSNLQNNMEFMGPRFKLLKESTSDAAAELEDEAYDFVFIDADHSMKAVLNDLDHYWPKLKPGGIMSGHDGNLFGVNFAVTSWAKKKGMDPTSIATMDNQAWWFRK